MKNHSIQTYPGFTGKGKDSAPRSYVISPEDAKVVDFSIKLGRPLLIEGEAGCGKTRLAAAIATEQGLAAEDLIVIPVRSSSKANDLLYRFDALRRLQDSQCQNSERNERSAWAHNYIRLEPLGRAILESKPCVILIDEIDKADSDFANDLLHVIDQFEFPIDEIPREESDKAFEDTGELRYMVKGSGKLRPIVVFTSNRENPLPLPFLRRCVYLELKFPNEREELIEIVELNLKKEAQERESSVLVDLSSGIINSAVEAFLKIREAAEKNNAMKKPATAELIDWVHALHWEPHQQKHISTITPPYWKLLFRSATDIEAHQQYAQSVNQRARK
ncbi:MAG: MoxR family ATPase [Agarilytica sp.]